MLRTLLLGKLSLSILASLVVGGVCLTQPWRDEYSTGESASWIAVGIFFLILGVAQIAVAVILTRKKK